MRLWGDSEKELLVCVAGSYNGAGLVALDRLLDMASQRGLKLILTLSSNWNEADGKIAVSCSQDCARLKTLQVKYRSGKGPPN